MNYHFFDLLTGLFSGSYFSGPREMVAVNTPSGMGVAESAGLIDPLACKVDVVATAAAQAAADLQSSASDPAVGVAPILVDYQPSAPADTALLTWTWAVDEKRWVGQPTAAALLDAARIDGEVAAQALLDSTAQGWGYDSLLSAASYGGSTVARFKAEAEALVAWRDALWSAAYGIEAEVAAGSRALPTTTQDFLALLPPAPARPTAAPA